jgi:hypothetical protein
MGTKGAEEWANEIAVKANECCNRSNGFEEDIRSFALKALKGHAESWGMSYFLLELLRTTTDQVNRWYAQLQKYYWPDDFPISKPDGFDQMSHAEQFYCKAFQIVCVGLQHILPSKEQMRILKVGIPHWSEGTGMTNEEFEEEWRKDHEFMESGLSEQEASKAG